MGRLDDKTVIVIGGAQGIGRGCVLAAAAEGAHVIVGDLNEDGARAVAAEASARGTRAIGMRADVVERDAGRRARRHCARRVRARSTDS